MTTTPPAGSDGIVPVQYMNSRWTQYNLSELYMGPSTPGSGKYVPNVNDFAVDVNLYQYYKVIAVDPTTAIPTLLPITGAIPDDQFSANDRLLAPAVGPEPNTFILFVNQGVKPFSCNVDQRCYIPGNGAVTCQATIGSPEDGSYKVISAMYDQSGNLIGQSIPLVPQNSVAVGPGNVLVQTVPSFSTTVALTNNQVVTMYFYNSAGTVVSLRQLVVLNSAVIPSPNVGLKYVVGISLTSPFLSSTNPTQIVYPLNVPLTGLNLMGVVNYSDGTSITLPVNGTKFTMMGLNSGYLATVIGQEIPLVLRYNLSPGEVAYGVSANSNGFFITQSYQCITGDADGQYSGKLFGYPVWVSAVAGYQMRWFLFNLDRNIWYDATAYVQYTTPLNPLAYGIQQALQVSVNLQSLNGSNPNFLLTQTLSVTLLNQATEQETDFTVAFTPGQSPVFGTNLGAVSTFISAELTSINLTNGFTYLTDWLTALYWNTQPLFDPSVEATAPTPNFFSLVVGNEEWEFPISQWNQSLLLSEGVANASTLFIRFFYRPGTGADLQLAIAGIPVWQAAGTGTNSGGSASPGIPITTGS